MRTRVTESHVIKLSASLGERDFQILETIDLLGLVTARQIERLHFWEIAESARRRIRQRVMRPLIKARAVAAFTRHKGGPQRWSGQQIYALDVAGERLMRQRQGISGTYRPTRKSLPGLQLLDHFLDVSELYVRIVESCRMRDFGVAEFATEPASWWNSGAEITIKPDAYLKLRSAHYSHHWWIEVDRGTESVPTVIRQLNVYLDFATHGGTGPSGVIPRVLVTVPTDARCTALRKAVSDLPGIADQLIRITPYETAVDVLAAHTRTAANEKGEPTE